jgi:hypothetical protein
MKHLFNEFSLDLVNLVSGVALIDRFSESTIVNGLSKLQSLSFRCALLAAELLLSEFDARIRVRLAHMAAERLSFSEAPLLADWTLK